MQPSSVALLWDIIDHADYILTRTTALTVDEYTRNRDVRFAIERAFHNVGEAARRLSISDSATADHLSDVRAIIGFRNVLAHNYDAIDDAKVFEIISTSLPRLLEEARALLPDE